MSTPSSASCAAARMIVSLWPSGKTTRAGALRARLRPGETYYWFVRAADDNSQRCSPVLFRPMP